MGGAGGKDQDLVANSADGNGGAGSTRQGQGHRGEGAAWQLHAPKPRTYAFFGVLLMYRRRATSKPNLNINECWLLGDYVLPPSKRCVSKWRTAFPMIALLAFAPLRLIQGLLVMLRRVRLAAQSLMQTETCSHTLWAPASSPHPFF